MKLVPLHDLPDEIVEIVRVLEANGFEAWCVGGAVRDRLLGHPADDVDIATSARPEQVQRVFTRTIAVGVKYGTVGVLDRRRVLHEVTTFRKDVATDGRHAEVAYGVSLEEDLARRDFTINALAYHPLRHEWRDPFGGAEDLSNGLIRAVGEPERRFAEDYLRILRMVRFAARFGFRIEPATWRAAVAAAEGLRGLSAERVREEWYKGIETARSRVALVRCWREVGAAAVWLPELRDPFPIPEPVGGVDPVVFTAAVCTAPHAVLRRLRASSAEVGRAEAIARGPERPSAESEVAVRRWLAEVGNGADDLMRLAELGSAPEPSWVPVVRRIRERGDPTSRSQLALTGDDLRKAGVAPGPALGQMLGRLLEAVIEDPSRNTREALLDLVRSWR